MQTALDVLVIDDSADDRFAYRRYLGRGGDAAFAVREAGSLGEGRAQIAEQLPALVLLDYHLPDGTGIEFLKTLRQTHPRLPVILLTGLEDVNTSVEALKAGADDYQIKGKIDADSLMRAVRGALERRALETQIATERERLELFYRLMEQSADILLVMSMPERRLIEFNQGAASQLGYRREQMLSHDFDINRVLPHIGTIWPRLTERQPGLRCDCEVVRADGSPLPVDANVQRVSLNGHDYFVLVLRDATERKRMEAEMQRLVLLDALTGVHNRRAFDERFAQEFARAARGHGSLGLLMIDIDHFKAYNDHYGHPAGDKCLRQVSQALAATLKRPSDFLARYGGEEFAVLLPDSTVAEAQKVGEMLIERVRQLELPHGGSSTAPHVSISIGACAATPPVRGLQEQFMTETDGLLYRAKATGRDRVVSSGQPFTHQGH